MSNIQAFLCETGVLLGKSDEEFETYSKAYDHKYGYYDTDQCYEKDRNRAIKNAYEHVKAGGDGTYAVVSYTRVPEDFDFQNSCVENESYLLEDVAYSVAKINGKIVENFIDAPEKAKAHRVIERD
jgi:hypothetical protein